MRIRNTNNPLLHATTVWRREVSASACLPVDGDG